MWRWSQIGILGSFWPTASITLLVAPWVWAVWSRNCKRGYEKSAPRPPLCTSTRACRTTDTNTLTQINKHARKHIHKRASTHAHIHIGWAYYYPTLWGNNSKGRGNSVHAYCSASVSHVMCLYCLLLYFVWVLQSAKGRSRDSGWVLKRSAGFSPLVKTDGWPGRPWDTSLPLALDTLKADRHSFLVLLCAVLSCAISSLGLG